jgi:hypothetical protein
MPGPSFIAARSLTAHERNDIFKEISLKLALTLVWWLLEHQPASAQPKCEVLRMAETQSILRHR